MGTLGALLGNGELLQGVWTIGGDAECVAECFRRCVRLGQSDVRDAGVSDNRGWR